MNDRQGERFLAVVICTSRTEKDLKSIFTESFLHWIKILVLPLENLQ